MRDAVEAGTPLRRALGRPSSRGRLPSGVLGWLVISASLVGIVMAVRHAQDLGPDPSWQFDCTDTTCTDLWSAARHHYAGVAVGAAVSLALGWFLVGLGTAQRGRERPRRRSSLLIVGFWTLLVLLADAATMISPWLVFSSGGVPGAVGSIAAGVLVQAVSLWGAIQSSSGARGRAAWWAAGGTAAAGTAAWVVLACLLFPALFVMSPMLAALVMPVVQGWALGGRRRGRSAADLPAADSGGRPTGDGLCVLPENGYRLPAVLWMPAVLALVTATAWACARVPAPPADAWEAAHGEEQTPPGPTPGTPSTSTASIPAPNPTASAMIAAEPGLASCTPEQLRIVVDGFEGVTGNSVAEIRGTNVGSARCALRGRPGVVLEQGGRSISLAIKPLADDEPAPPPGGVALDPEMSATARLAWPGYRNAADQKTPQNVSIVLGSSGIAHHVRFAGRSSGGYTADVGPAPFDIKAGVPGGAILSIGRWRTA